jgi:tetratricopeptide (TPR) repeat protein
MRRSLLFIFCFLLTASCFAQKDTLRTESGIKYFFLTKGKGPALTPGWIAIWQYRLTLTDGTKIDASWDRSSPFAAQYPSKQIIKGVTEALSLMHIGDSAIFIIPADLCYGEKGVPPSIPPMATLVFNMKLISMKEKSLQVILDSLVFENPLTDSSKPRMKEVMDTYEALRKQHFNDLYVSEDDFNNLGYELIKKFPKDAVECFKLNVKLYPNSWNVYDSLGEGYMALGENDAALLNYEKSVQLNPDNKNGLEMIKKLKSIISKNSA